MHVLIVEDDKKTAQLLRRGLAEQGFAVDVRYDGEDGLRAAADGGYDAVVLDIMLPRRDGWSVLSELRAKGNRVPVLCLTARDSVPDRVKGLELGADDYVVKPFAFAELVARLRTIVRRVAPAPGESVHVGDLEIDLLGDKAHRAGHVLDLTPKEFALLAQMARHRGETLSRDFLAERVWNMRWSGDTNIVDVHIRRLRSKVDDPYAKKLIHTIRGVGYVLDDRA